MMRELPMLFSGAMVNAIYADLKTETRRIAKLTASGHVKEPRGNRRWHPDDPAAVAACPYQVGDRLWVRETWGLWDTEPGDGPERATVIFMPRWASRLTLEVTGRRLERLQAITEEGAIAEGVTCDLLSRMLEPTASRHRRFPCHWIDQCDEGVNYCLQCCEREVRKLRRQGRTDVSVDGGWIINHDSSPSCEICGKCLQFMFTDYGAMEELAHCERSGIAHDPMNTFEAYEALNTLERRSDLAGAIARVGFRYLWDRINGKRSPWSENRPVWVISFRRLAEDES